MRISDWSSDVCSSDLNLPIIHNLVDSPSLAAQAVDNGDGRIESRDGRGLTGSSCWHIGHDRISPGLHAPTTSTSSLNLIRSEEHTSALQSLMRISYAVFCFTKKKAHYITTSTLTIYTHDNHTTEHK